jgi:hypothetical protein
MQTLNVFTLSVAASLMVSAMAKASDATALPWNIASIQGVASVSPERYSTINWTALIGTGEAAAVEAGVAKSDTSSVARARDYPHTDWTSAIGTGRAAALEQRELGAARGTT